MGLFSKLIKKRREKKNKEKVYKALASDALRCGSSVGGKCMSGMRKRKKK